MKTILLAAVAVAALALPALAGEGNGDPFPMRSTGTTATIALRRADTGSDAYPSSVARPGSAMNLYAADTVPSTGSEQTAETANSLPRGFERGLPIYADRKPRLSNIVVGNSIYLPRG
jgi:hypothetical protein